MKFQHFLLYLWNPFTPQWHFAQLLMQHFQTNSLQGETFWDAPSHLWCHSDFFVHTDKCPYLSNVFLCTPVWFHLRKSQQRQLLTPYAKTMRFHLKRHVNGAKHQKNFCFSLHISIDFLWYLRVYESISREIHPIEHLPPKDRCLNADTDPDFTVLQEISNTEFRFSSCNHTVILSSQISTNNFVSPFGATGQNGGRSRHVIMELNSKTCVQLLSPRTFFA